MKEKGTFMTRNDRVNFGSKLGVILASAGSAVGLGNIWRFPYETGNHGGAAFILIYLACVLLLGIPIMIAEFLIGRRSDEMLERVIQRLQTSKLHPDSVDFISKVFEPDQVQRFLGPL